MIGLDANVLVRYIMQDDAEQSAKASSLIESLDGENPGFITLVTIVEMYWVLTSCFDLSKDQAAQALNAILRTRQLVVERADQVHGALRVFNAGNADFADCLISQLAISAGCTEVVTFDTGAAKYASMTLVR